MNNTQFGTNFAFLALRVGVEMSAVNRIGAYSVGLYYLFLFPLESHLQAWEHHQQQQQPQQQVQNKRT